jgi:hypothetical protein
MDAVNVTMRSQLCPMGTILFGAMQGPLRE